MRLLWHFAKKRRITNNNPQLLVIRQHEAIAAANVPSVFETLPGWDQHQVLGNIMLDFLGGKQQTLGINDKLANILFFVASGRPECCAGAAGNLSRTERPRRCHRQVTEKLLWLFLNENFAGFSPRRASLPALLEGDRAHQRVNQNSFRNITICWTRLFIRFSIWGGSTDV